MSAFRLPLVSLRVCMRGVWFSGLAVGQQSSDGHRIAATAFAIYEPATENRENKPEP